MLPAFLYVEDDTLSREIMEMILRGLGYTQLIVFEDSHDFAARLDNLDFTPNVIFLDIHIKPHDGFEMLKILRRHPRLGGQKIIALTASVMNEEVIKLQQAGFDGAISKPLDFDEFPSLLEQILNGERIWHIG
jgi:CheY-like chemotaxis protein